MSLNTINYALQLKGDAGLASGFDHAVRTGDNTFSIFFTDGSQIDLTIPIPLNGKEGKDGVDGVSVTNAKINASSHLIVTLSDGTEIDAGVASGGGGGGQPYDDTEIRNMIGDTSKIAVSSIHDLVTYCNALYNNFMKSISYANKTLSIEYRNGQKLDVDVSNIITDTNVEELKNVVVSTLSDGEVMTYDKASGKWTNKAVDLSGTLQSAKDYIDNAIKNIEHADAIACDEKPSLSGDTITYKKDGTVKTTTNMNTWFYYVEDEKTVQTIFVDGVEFTLDVVGGVDFSEYVKKTDIAESVEDADKTKIVKLSVLDESNAKTTEELGKKVNVEDIVDALNSEASDKPLSANQGRVLNRKIDNFQNVWVGTKAEFESADHSSLKDGQGVVFTDDYVDSTCNVYSTEEYWTGKYWIDGKKIYGKVLVFENNTSATISIPSNLTNVNIKNMYGTVNTSNASCTISYSTGIITYYNYDSEVLVVTKPSSYTNGEITIEYTKVGD